MYREHLGSVHESKRFDVTKIKLSSKLKLSPKDPKEFTIRQKVQDDTKDPDENRWNRPKVDLRTEDSRVGSNPGSG